MFVVLNSVSATEGAVADVYSAQQHVRYAAWWLKQKKKKRGREGRVSVLGQLPLKFMPA